MTPENKVKAWAISIIRKHFPNAWIYKAPGGPFGRAGVPDLIMCIEGLFIAIEAKADKTGKLSERQIYECRKINRSGGMAFKLLGKDHDAMNRIIKRIRLKVQNFNCVQ